METISDPPMLHDIASAERLYRDGLSRNPASITFRTSFAWMHVLMGRFDEAQRLFEAVLAGCLPLLPYPIPAAAAVTPGRLHVVDGRDVIERVRWAQQIAGTAAHVSLIADCLARLEPFRLSGWTSALTCLMSDLVVTAAAGR